MPYRILIERRAEKDLDKLSKEIRRKIILAILNLKNNPKPANIIKISASDYYRIRVGDYRIIYELRDKEKIVNIFRIRHRKEAYQNL